MVDHAIFINVLNEMLSKGIHILDPVDASWLQKICSPSSISWMAEIIMLLGQDEDPSPKYSSPINRPEEYSLVKYSAFFFCE